MLPNLPYKCYVKIDYVEVNFTVVIPKVLSMTKDQHSRLPLTTCGGQANRETICQMLVAAFMFHVETSKFRSLFPRVAVNLLMRCQHPIWKPIHVPRAPFLIHLPVHDLGKAMKDAPCVWIPITLGDEHEAAVFCLQLAQHYRLCPSVRMRTSAWNISSRSETLTFK